MGVPGTHVVRPIHVCCLEPQRRCSTRIASALAHHPRQAYQLLYTFSPSVLIPVHLFWARGLSYCQHLFMLSLSAVPVPCSEPYPGATNEQPLPFHESKNWSRTTSQVECVRLRPLFPVGRFVPGSRSLSTREPCQHRIEKTHSLCATQ